jgi:UDP-glucose 4-epimerase
MKVAVIGAQGWVGRSTVQALRSEESAPAVEELICVDRPGTGPDTMPWNCLEPDSVTVLTRHIRNCDAVIHCAGLAHRSGFSRQDAELFQRVNAEGTAHVVEACRQGGVRRLVHVSTIAVYDWQASVPAGNVRLVSPRGTYAQSKHAGELAIQRSDLDWRIVRLATVFGTGDIGNFSRLARQIAHRRFAVPGSGHARKSVIPNDLAGRILARMAGSEILHHRVLDIALPEAPSVREIADTLADLLGVPHPPRLPEGVFRVLAWVGQLLVPWGLPFPVHQGTVEALTRSTVVETQLLTTSGLLTGVPCPTFREAMVQHASFYRTLTRRSLNPSGDRE